MKYVFVYISVLVMFLAVFACKKKNSEPESGSQIENNLQNPVVKDRFVYENLYALYDYQTESYSRVDLDADGKDDVLFVSGQIYGSGGLQEWDYLSFLDTTWKICIKTYSAQQVCANGSYSLAYLHTMNLAINFMPGDTLFANQSFGSSFEGIYYRGGPGSSHNGCSDYIFNPFSFAAQDNCVGLRRNINSKVQLAWLRFRSSNKGWQLLEMLKFREGDFVIIGK